MKRYSMILLLLMMEYTLAMDKQLTLQHTNAETIPLLPKSSSILHELLITSNNEIKRKKVEKEIKKKSCGRDEIVSCCYPLMGGASTWLVGTFLCESCGNPKALWGYVALTSLVCCICLLCDDDK